ncbi:MAG TPA: DUF2950 family protein [Verrucomicrobiae bacterium]|nr:DUF2950 family protein [Verrucomicrobiae bacterium]
MDTQPNKSWKWIGIAIIAVLVLAVVGLTNRNVESRFLSPVTRSTKQITFASPAEASTALANAAKADDNMALGRILGPDTMALLLSGDTESDKAAVTSFVSKYEQMNRWVDMTDGTRVLYIGADNFAFPVPLAKNSSGRWYFDAVAGAEEVRARTIGRNEILAMDASYALAKAEEIFYSEGDSPEFAQQIVSSPGRQNGLYWPARDEQGVSPLGDITRFPKASLASISSNQPLVVDGYELRILTAQGGAAAGGPQSYIVNGKMTGGFAILATPVKYGETGIMTFMNSNEGTLYERDFGPDTQKAAASLTAYNPTDDWTPVE